MGNPTVELVILNFALWKAAKMARGKKNNVLIKRLSGAL
jgi:hypothetical protein